ncbi:hypothetical protein PULV_b0280 [Pseudoalteromonas ulvae UL12]|nr:hypothetical protein [Pseudoalteromonas ulvae UL12]
MVNKIEYRVSVKNSDWSGITRFYTQSGFISKIYALGK